MRKLKLFLSLLMLMAFSLGNVWAVDYDLIYTLDGSVTTGMGNSNYAEAGDGGTQDGIKWFITGNTTMNPWRIGGKNLSGEDRTLYSATAMSSNVAKIEIQHNGASSVTVNSMKVEVASNADFSTIVSTLTPTFVATGTVEVTRPAGKDWSNCYYRITYNVTIGGSNKYIAFVSAKFYKEAEAAAFDITAVSNNDAFGTVALSGSVITATPKEGYRIASTAYTVTTGTATVERGTGENINKFTVTPTTDCTVQINFEVIPQYTVTWDVNGATSTSKVNEGAQPVFPETPASCDGTSTTFVGWATAPWIGKIANLDGKTVYTKAANMPAVTSDVTYYAVFAKVAGGSAFDGVNGGTFKIYALVNDTKYYALGTLTSGKINPTEDAAEAADFKVEAVSGGFTIKSGDKYISYSTSTNLAAGDDPYTWSIIEGSHGSWRINSATDGRAWIYRAGTTNKFGGYSTGNVNGTEYFDLEISGNSSYSDYMTTCAPIVKYLVQVAVNDPDMGSATINGGASYESTEDDVLNLVATPNSGFEFVEWTYDDTKVILDDANAASTTAIASDAVTITANFQAKTCTDPEAVMTISKTEAVVGDEAHFSFTSNADFYDNAVVTRDGNPATSGVDYAVDLNTYVVEPGRCEGDFTALKAGTFVISMHQDAQDIYCEADKEVTVVVNQPAATLTLSENGEEHLLEGSYTLEQIINLPATASQSCESKVFRGWSANAECAVAPEYAPGDEFIFASTAEKLYAVYAIENSTPLANHELGSATMGGENGNTASEGYVLSSFKVANKSGFVQDAGTYDSHNNYIQILASSQIITEQPSAINFTAHLGAGAVREEMTYPVYVTLVNAEGANVGEPVVLTNSIPDKAGSDFPVSLPTANYADVRGVKISHLKENGWNVRYYTFALSYTTGGTAEYSNYSTTCQSCKQVILSKAETEHGSFVLKMDEEVVESVKTCSATQVAVIATPDPEYRLGEIAVSGIEGAVYADGIISIPADAEGTLTVSVSFAEKAEANIHWSVEELSVALDAWDGELYLSRPEAINKADITFTSTNPDAVEIHNGDKLHGDIARWATGEATLTASFPGNEYYKAAEVSCHITITAGEWKEILFKDLAVAGTLNGQVLKPEGSEFSLSIVDNSTQFSVDDASSAKFGDLEHNKQYYHRLKTGGSTNSNKRLTLSFTDNGILRLAPRSASSTATDRVLTLTQNEVDIYSDIVKDEDVVVDPENPNKKVYPYVTVPVKEGTVEISVSGGMNFYAMGFKANPKHAVSYETPEHGSLVVKKGDEIVTSGTELTEGTVLTITATPDAGFRNPAITVNGNPLEGNTYELGSADITIAASFEPIPNIMVYFVNKDNWDAVFIHLWNAAEATTKTTSWPGIEVMNKLEEKINGYDVYSYSIDPALDYDMCIFNNGDNGLQTADLTIEDGKYYYGDGWYNYGDIPVLRLENGFYLIGQYGFDVENIPADLKFIGPDETGQYKLDDVELTQGQTLKVVYVKDDAIATWFPGGETPNYEVDNDHKGTTDIYFRPDGNGNDDWFYRFFYVLPTSSTGTAIDNAADGKNAVKVLRNDVIYIIKGGKTYNITGQRVK